jgi:hypothetical protein
MKYESNKKRKRLANAISVWKTERLEKAMHCNMKKKTEGSLQDISLSAEGG